METIILAGGFGTRLQGVVTDVPKPMADINGKPFLSYLFDYLLSQNINRVLLSVGYKYEIIKEHFGSKYDNLSIEYIIENKPLGTGGAIRKALEHTKGKNVIFLNGDTLFTVDLKGMLDFHLSRNSILTLALKPMHNVKRYGAVVLENDKITGFEEKSFKEFGYINGGIYVVDKIIADYLKGYKDSFSFEAEFLQENIENIRSFGFISNDYFIDIGIPEDYERARKELGCQPGA